MGDVWVGMEEGGGGGRGGGGAERGVCIIIGNIQWPR